MTTDSALAKFVTDYADNLYMNELRQLKGHNSIGTRMRKHAIIRTDAKEIPPFFVKTGLSALAEHGLEAIMPDYNDLYFDLDQERRELSLETAFVHALWMVSLKQRQDMTVLTIFFAKNRKKMNPRTLRELAKFYNDLDIVSEIHGKADFADTMREN